MNTGKYKFITATGQDAFRSSFDLAYSFDLYGFAGVQIGRRKLYIDLQGDTPCR